MDIQAPARNTYDGGIVLDATGPRLLDEAREKFMSRLAVLGLADCVVAAGHRGGDCAAGLRLHDDYAREWAPGYDTTRLCSRLRLKTETNDDDLEREIVVAMLAGPLAFRYPSYEEFSSAVRIRQNIVRAARKTALSFHTTEAERPAEYWAYAEDTGFTLRPGKCLVTALQKTTQPEPSQGPYSFSCYRATEYVILLGLAQELRSSHPAMYLKLQKQWESRAIMSGRFHDVFLREHGTMTEPMPLRYFVPGDRTWFRNPDSHSSDVCGYEGSWVMYLGGGLFNNFWEREKPYTLDSKCIEIYHWRHATYTDREGELQLDENVVRDRLSGTLKDREETGRILSQMMRHREPGGVYLHGGCIDTTREYVRWVRPGTCDLTLPEKAAI